MCQNSCRLLVLALSFFWVELSYCQTREQKVRGDKAHVEAQGFWIYNDLPRAFQEGAAAGKPIVVVLRCIPCEECVKLDDELIDGDPLLQPLLEQFIRVRVVSTNGLDLSLFQFDTDQSFAMFMLNADGTIYGRFGTRSHRTEWIGDVSVEGMAQALTGALKLHKNYPQNRAELAAKRGPVPEFDRPEKLPPHQGKYTSSLDYQGKLVASCIHCHQIGDAQREIVLSKGDKLPEQILFPYPHPKMLGMILNPQERATVAEVVADSDAARAGFAAGDVIERLNGQPLLSIADIQWVLHQSPADGTELPADIVRAGQPLTLMLKLAPGWRRRDDIAWRASTWELRRRALGGMYLVKTSQKDLAASQLPAETQGLRVEHVGQHAPHNLAQQAGILAGDILVSFDGLPNLLRETDLIAHVLDNKRPGDEVKLTMVRGGDRHEFKYQVPR